MRHLWFGHQCPFLIGDCSFDTRPLFLVKYDRSADVIKHCGSVHIPSLQVWEVLMHVFQKDWLRKVISHFVLNWISQLVLEKLVHKLYTDICWMDKVFCDTGVSSVNVFSTMWCLLQPFDMEGIHESLGGNNLPLMPASMNSSAATRLCKEFHMTSRASVWTNSGSKSLVFVLINSPVVMSTYNVFENYDPAHLPAWFMGDATVCCDEDFQRDIPFSYF